MPEPHTPIPRVPPWEDVNPSPMRTVAAAVLAALALASTGCGTGSSPDVGKVVDESARAASAVTRRSHQLTQRWCPEVVAHHGRTLTRRQARACLARARRGWLRELRRHGYEPGRPWCREAGARRR